MALTVQTNTAAITALKNLNTNSANMNNSLNRLSSGFRINSAADDASGFAISSKLSAQGGRLKAASQNATQATAMVKMADAGVNEIQNMLNRIQTLATQAASANNSGELGKLDAERVKLESQINKIANATNYNGVNLLNGVDVNSTAAAVAAVAAVPGNAAVASTAVDATGTGAGTSSATISGGTIAAGTAAGTVISTITYGAAAVNDTIAITGGAGLTGSIAAGSVSYGGLNTVTLSDGSSLALTLGTRPANATGTGVADTLTITAGTAAVLAQGAVAAKPVGAYAAALDFQVGADNTANNRVSLDLTKSYTTTALGLSTITSSGTANTQTANSNLKTQAHAQAYIDTAKSALNTLIKQRADLGATQNQLGFVQANLATSIEQTTASVSSIKDADMAAEMANFTKNKILTQAGTSMLAQANQAAQNVLTLFR